MNNKKDTRLKILSVVVAIVMWAFVINSTNPTVNKVFRQVPVVIRNQDDLESSGYTIIGEQETYSTNIKLKGSRERLVNLREENIYAYIDISELREGVQSIQIDVDTPTGIAVDELDPGQINLNIQRVLEKKLPVNLIISDEIRDGRIVEVNEMTPKEITVKGPAGLINNVDRVEAKIDEEELLDGKIHNVDLNVVDRSGNPIASLSLSDDDINISFRVYETKRVPITFETSGELPKGYEETLRVVSPETVVLKGPESVIRDISEVKTKVINLSNLKRSITSEVSLDLPESVEVYDGEDSVTYKIEIQRKPAEIKRNTTTESSEEETNEDEEN